VAWLVVVAGYLDADSEQQVSARGLLNVINQTKARLPEKRLLGGVPQNKQGAEQKLKKINDMILADRELVTRLPDEEYALAVLMLQHAKSNYETYAREVIPAANATQEEPSKDFTPQTIGQSLLAAQAHVAALQLAINELDQSQTTDRGEQLERIKYHLDSARSALETAKLVADSLPEDSKIEAAGTDLRRRNQPVPAYVGEAKSRIREMESALYRPSGIDAETFLTSASQDSYHPLQRVLSVINESGEGSQQASDRQIEDIVQTLNQPMPDR
jgi:hypothetical protein